MSSGKKVLIAVIVLAVLGAVYVLNLQSDRTPTTEVEAEAVKSRQLVSIVEASGQIEPSISVDISSDVIGRIVAIGPEEGDRVEKGDFLVQIDPTQLEQRMAQFEAALASSQARKRQNVANLEKAELEHQRQRNLWEKELIPEADFDVARVALNVARADIEAADSAIHQAQASLEEARDSLSKCRILAPMTGIVIRKNAEVGETAISGTLNNAGSLLMTIADLSAMETEVEVDETDVVDLRLGQETEIELDAFPDEAFSGVVTKIANSSVLGQSSVGQPQQSANYKVTVRLTEMPDTIRPGLSATARITTAVREEALSVPIQSLVIRELEEDSDQETSSEGGEGAVAQADTGTPAADNREVPLPEPGDDEEEANLEKEGIFVIRDDVVKFVPVEVGIAGEKHFEVTGDIQAGDMVVSGPFSALRKLKDGDAVKLKSEDDKKEKGKDSESDSA
jgi:HlyD family secretion protein